jgi:hypothetical protein
MSPKLKYDIIPVSEVPKEDAIVVRANPWCSSSTTKGHRGHSVHHLAKGGFTTMTAWIWRFRVESRKKSAPDLPISDVVGARNDWHRSLPSPKAHHPHVQSSLILRSGRDSGSARRSAPGP